MLFRSAHVRAYHRYQRQENRRLQFEAWRKEELAICEQEEAWTIAQQQKRARLEVELRGRKANNNTAAPTSPRRSHAVKTTVLEQIPVDREEQCEGPACGGRGDVAWVLEMQEFDEEEQDLVNIRFFVCSACNNKHKKKFDTRTIVGRTLYVVETKTVSKEVITWMSDELTTLLDLLPAVTEEIKRALLDTLSNQIMLWDLAGEKALTHFGKVLSAKEKNQLMHTLNGNILGCIRAREHNSAEWNESDWEHVQLHRQERRQARRQESPYSREIPRRSARLLDLPLSNFNVGEIEELSWKGYKTRFREWKRKVERDAHHQWSIPGMEKKTRHGYKRKEGKITSIQSDFEMHGHHHQYRLPIQVDNLIMPS